MADPIVNFFKSTLVGTYSSTDTSLTIATGDGALLPDPSTDGAFNLVIYQGTAGVQADAFEIVRVTAISGDVLTVTRQQEGTSALTIGDSVYSIILSATKKTFDDKADGSTTITAGSGLTGGGDLSANRTLNIGQGTGITVSADAISTNDSQIVHDNLSGFVANEHIDHSTVSISAGTGLTGGGDITASRTISHADTSTLSGAYGGSADGVVIEDITVDALGHVTAVGTVDLDSRFLGISAKASDADLLDGQDSTYYTNYNNLTNKPTIPTVNDATITISAGTGLSGGGDLTTNQSLNETITISHADTSTLSGSYGGANNGVVIEEFTVDANGHVTAIGTVDLDGRFLGFNDKASDADLLDGQDSTYYLNYNNLTNKPTIPSAPNNATITVSAGTGLSGGGDFTTDQSTAETITISHADTSTLSGSYGGAGNGVVIEDFTVDANGHVTAIGTVDLDGRFLGISAKASDSDLLDGLNSTSFVRTDTTSSISGDNYVTVGPNSTWSSYIRFGGNGRTVNGDAYASVVTTNGNLHIDAGNTRATYINFYAGTSGVAFGSGASGIVAWMGPDGDLWKGSSDNSGSKYWHAGNDGSGSGLDADTLDGNQASAFALTSHTHDDRYYTESESDTRFIQKNTGYTWTGTGGNALSFRSNDVLENGTGDQASLEIYQDTAGADAFMQFHVASDYAVNFGLKGDINDLAVGGWSMGATYYRIWHAGNDGSGSGLDADTLDGIQGANFLRSDTSDTMSGSLTVTGTVTATTFTETSAREKKENIEPLESALSLVNKLNPVRYNFIDNTAPEIGFIADEVYEIFPEFVTENIDGISYSKMVSVLTKAIQELTDKVNKLENGNA